MSNGIPLSACPLNGAVRLASQLTLAFVLASGYGLACASSGGGQRGQEAMSQRSIEEVLRDRTPEWMSVPGVVGTGIGKCDDQPCIRVMVAKKTPEILDKIPSKVEGYVVDIVETGVFRPRPPG